MNDYILKLNEFINQNYEYPERINVAVVNKDIYLIHISGYGEEHCFSVKLSRFPNDAISFYGYNIEKTLDLNEANFEIIKQLIIKAINFGVALTIINGRSDRFELLFEEQLTESSVKELCAKIDIKSNHNAVRCSNFLGTQIFEIEF